MTKRIVFLSPQQKLVDAVADSLLQRIRETAEGVLSLDHLAVVVPTAQSGRRLRLALARRVSPRALLPPRIFLPLQLVVPIDTSLRIATPVELRAAFLAFLRLRPMRTKVGEKLMLTEWTHLFRPESVTEVHSHLDFFDQLADLWQSLAKGGLLLREVASHPTARAVLESAVGEECARWQELGAFETAFFEFLHQRGLRAEVEAIHSAKVAAMPLATEIEEVILPALVDPVSVLYAVLLQQRDTLVVTVMIKAEPSQRQRFDEWGRPLVAEWTGANAPLLEGLRHEDLVRTSTPQALAQAVVEAFPPVHEVKALPALGLCDEAIFPELAAAFLNVGRELHNPERHWLAASSLGRVVMNLIALYATRAKGWAFAPFAALLREADVLGWVMAQLPHEKGESRPTRVEVLAGLDVCQHQYMPAFLPTELAFDLSRLAGFQKPSMLLFLRAAKVLVQLWASACAGALSAATAVRVFLERLYAARSIGAEAKEFCSAAAAARAVLLQFESPQVVALQLPEAALTGLLRKQILMATYSLEPDSAAAILSEGWLELAWSEAEQVALVGLNEGCVPDTVVGHAFLPDALREALALTSNAQRLARDTYLLADLLSSRASRPGRVRVYFAQADEAGDLHRPSRLLFLVRDEALPARVKALFGALPPERPRPRRVIPEGWSLRLPLALETYGKSTKYPNGRLTASAIDAWLKCPFTYLFEYGLGMRLEKARQELEANDFGTLVHRALELYARSQLERTAQGLDQLSNEAQIVAALHGIMDNLRQSYGAHQRLGLRLQLEAAENRLRAFAKIQAWWAQQGWRVAEAPEYSFVAHPFAGEGEVDVPVRGSIDRIDYCEGVGYRLIDFKTWDECSGAASRILKGGVAEVAHAQALALPLVSLGTQKRRFLSVQLPLYGRCLEVTDAKFAGKIADYGYVILGKSEAETGVLMSGEDQGPFEVQKRQQIALREFSSIALATARAAILRIRAQHFWPPGPSATWQYDLKKLFFFSPEQDLPPTHPWRQAQEAKLRQLAAEQERQG